MKKFTHRLERLVLILIPVVLLLAIGGGIESWVSPRPVHGSSQFANIVCDQWKPLSVTANAQVITAGNANMFIYICSVGTVAGAADNFSIVEGTGAVCATNTVALIGGTTAATGMNLALNGVFTEGSGTGAIARTAVAGDNVCILRSSAGPLSGNLSWTTAAS